MKQPKIDMKWIEKIPDYLEGKLSKEDKREFERKERELDKIQGWKNGKKKKK